MTVKDIREARLERKDEKSLLAVVDELRDRVIAGEIESITMLVELMDGSFYTAGSTTEDRCKTAGTLLEMAVQRLGYGMEL